MDFVNAVILGIIEGVTEFLPISSTGHLILISDLLKIPSSEFLKSFEISIQLGAILAVAILYGKSFLLKWMFIKKIIVAFIPTGLIGFLLYRFVRTMLGNHGLVLWALFLGGIFLIVFELLYKPKSGFDDLNSISYKQSFLIGLSQSLAVIPGVSRAAATIVGGLAMGINRKTIVEFSFLLAVPTILAATGYDFLKSYHQFSMGQFEMLAVGFIISFLTALAAIKFLVNFVKGHTFISFGIYRIIAAFIFWFFIL